jgi:hypothetical protein
VASTPYSGIARIPSRRAGGGIITPVATCDGGHQPIETLVDGDNVLTRDTSTGVTECRRIVHAYARKAEDVTTLSWRTAEGAYAELHVTAEHPIWIEGKEWVNAGRLAAGDQGATATGTRAEFVWAAGEADAQWVYNVEVEETHTYFVGEMGVLAHNACEVPSRILGAAMTNAGVARAEGMAAHHIVAHGALAADPARAVLAKFGIGINDAANGVFLPGNSAATNGMGAAVHSVIHTAKYYRTVNEILSGAATREQALQQLGAIRDALLRGGL